MIVSKVLPIVLLISIGGILKKINFIKQSAIDELKKVIINITLPALLFVAFIDTTLESRYLLICLSVLLTCIIMLMLGHLFKKIFRSENKYFPSVFASFETGMIGYSIFVAVFGVENTYKLAILDLGHIIFVFLVFVGYLDNLNGKTASIKQLAFSFVKSPVIIAVTIGGLLSAIGATEVIRGFSISNSILETIELLANVTVPLICVIIGYELHFDFRNIAKPILTALLRMSILITLAFLINTFLIEGILHLDRVFKIAVYTLFLLPPTFLVPIYIKDNGKDKQFVLNTISVHIVLSLTAFLIVNLVV